MIARHAWSIDPAQYLRHEQRRGRRHAFEYYAASRTALVVIDMVPFFVEANSYTQGIVANINTLAAAVRSNGGVVAWVAPKTVAPHPARVEFLGPEVAERYRTSGGGGVVRNRLDPSLESDDGDLFVEKAAASAFFPGSSPLAADLATRNVDTILLAGTVANVCVESSARDASTLGYRTVVVADAVSAISDADLNASLRTIYRSFGDVRPTVDVVDLIAKPHPPAPPG